VSPAGPDQINALLEATPRGATIYLVGAGGCGVSGLGHLLLDLGFSVAGSDLALNEEIEQLRARGAQILLGHEAGRVAAARPALLVYSSAIRPDNLELIEAQGLRVPIVRRAVLLAALQRRQDGICVAGMHGKTTTSAWLAFALERLGAQPSWAVGAAVPQLSRAARYRVAPDRSQHWFVAEADESDGTLREFSPQHAIILNVDQEHFDYFANFDAVCAEFAGFAREVRGDLIFCADDPHLAGLFGAFPRAHSYGFNALAEYCVRPQATLAGEDGSRFEVWHRERRLGAFGIRLLGEKNISNATAVIALLDRMGFAADAIAEALAPFQGAARRQQELFHDARYRVCDDYGHHPNEIRATLQALKTSGARRLLVAFQPHRYSRTLHLLPQFATCFQLADQLWLTEIYAASEPPIAGVSGAGVAEAVRATGRTAEFADRVDDLPRLVRQAMQPGDLVLFLGAGDITRAAHQLAADLRNERPTAGEGAAAELSARLSAAATLRQNEPLAKRTTLRVGGRADIYVEPASEADLAAVLRYCAERNLPFVLLGRGSNLLIRDGGIRGVVICLAHPNFSRVEVTGERIHCGAGAKLKAVAMAARRSGLSGLEFLEGIPGSVGGGLRMNAGAMGAWMFDAVESIRFMDFDGQTHERKASEVNVEYRGCPLFKTHIALGATLKGQAAPVAAIEERMRAYSQKRWTSQPAAPSAGCIFKNPATIPAGKLIDELGLKGTNVGHAAVSILHGNFIVNDGGAAASDVLNLIELIRQRARAARGIELETEVEIIGEDATS